MIKNWKIAILASLLSIMLILSACAGSPADNLFGGGDDDNSSSGNIIDDSQISVVNYSQGVIARSYFHVQSGYEISLGTDNSFYFVRDGDMFFGTYVYNEGYLEFNYEDGSYDTGYFGKSDPEHPNSPILQLDGMGQFISADVYWGDSEQPVSAFVGEFYYEGTGAYVAFYADGTFGFFDEYDIIDPDFYEGDYEVTGGKIILRSDYHSFNYTFYVIDADTIEINGLDGYFHRTTGGSNNGGELPPPPAYYAAFEEYDLYYQLPNTGRQYFMNGVYHNYEGGFNYYSDDCDIELALHSVDDNGDGTQTTSFTAYIYFINTPMDTAMDSSNYTSLFDYYTGYFFKFYDSDYASYTLPYNGRDIVIELTKDFTYDYYVEDSYLLFTIDYTMVSPIGYDGLMYSFDRAAYTYEDSRARVDESYSLAYGTPFYEYYFYYMYENAYFKILN